jgi:hypothetical protein
MSITPKAKILRHPQPRPRERCRLKIETVSPLAKLKPDRLTASPEERRYRSNFSQLSLVRGTIRYLRTLKATALASSGDTASLNLVLAGPIRDPLQRGGDCAMHAQSVLNAANNDQAVQSPLQINVPMSPKTTPIQASAADDRQSSPRRLAGTRRSCFWSKTTRQAGKHALGSRAYRDRPAIRLAFCWLIPLT